MTTSATPMAGGSLVSVGDLHPRVDSTARIAPTAVIAGDVELGPDVNVWYGAVLRAEYATIRIGGRTNIQDGVVVHVDPDKPVNVGEGCSIGHHAVLHGCRIGDGSLVGMSATVMNDAVVPPRCLVAAGALVLSTCVAEEGWLIAGMPARPRRPLTSEELETLEWGVGTYLECSDLHAFSGAPEENRYPAGTTLIHRGQDRPREPHRPDASTMRWDRPQENRRLR